MSTTRKEKKVPTRPWREIRAKALSPEKLAQLDQELRDEMLEMDLREIRAMTGISQADLAKAAAMSQPEVSRLERRGDAMLSTLRRLVEGLGGELEVVAAFGNRRVRLRALG